MYDSFKTVSKKSVSECLTVTFPRLYLQRMFNGTCLLVQSGMKTRLEHCNTPVNLGSFLPYRFRSLSILPDLNLDILNDTVSTVD
jgi:hypothetical protein